MKERIGMLTFDDEILGGVQVGPRPSVKQLNRSTQAALDADDPLAEIIQRAIDKREWIEDSAVVLIFVQECECCGTRHEFCHGWFTGKYHTRDATARQLVRGKPVGYFPAQVQRVMQEPVAVCGACAESQVLIEEACRGS